MLQADGEMQCWTSYVISRLPNSLLKSRLPHVLGWVLVYELACPDEWYDTSMGLYRSEKERRWSGERLSPFNQLSRCCQISQNIVFGKMNTYKNTLYTLCPTMMDGKGLIVCRNMKKFLLTHFGQTGKWSPGLIQWFIRSPKCKFIF